MRELTLQEISNLDSGEIIPSFRATIKKVFDQTTGQGNYGTWFAQGMELSAGTQTIHATWFGEDNLKEIEGQIRLFESSETKHGLRGLSWDVKKKNGKQYEGIKITEVAKIKPTNGNNLSGGVESRHAGSLSADNTSPRRPSGEKSDSESSDSPAQNNLEGITEARQHLCQAANLYNLCVKAVDAIVAPELPEIAQTSEQFQAAVASLFIEASRAGLVAKMPRKPVNGGNDKAEKIPGQENWN